MENGVELHRLAETMTTKLNPLLYRDIWLVNDYLLPNFKGMADFRGQICRSEDRIKTDLNAAGRLVFLFFLCQELNVLLNIATGIQELMVAIATGNGSNVEVGCGNIYLIFS